MMNDGNVINQILVRLFRRINMLEERTICRDRFKDITINELHVIEAIGDEGSKSMTTIAKALDVTTGTLTISVNALVRKGLAQRIRSEEDRRVVLVSLTELGREANARHSRFHEEMTDAILSGLNDGEIDVLSDALVRLNEFFESMEVNYGGCKSSDRTGEDIPGH